MVGDVVGWLGLLAESDETATDKLHFNESITLKGVSFNYCGHNSVVLDQIDLTIRKGQKIGLIGQTGSGKSTLVDLVMGLLNPSEGVLLVDQQEITQGNVNNWRANIAHVPQSIFLSDSSIAENIAFGVSVEKIDNAL